jgi:hypothetical protein
VIGDIAGQKIALIGAGAAVGVALREAGGGEIRLKALPRKPAAPPRALSGDEIV